MNAKNQKKEELNLLIRDFFYFKKINDKETVLQEITNLITKSSYLSEGINTLVSNSVVAVHEATTEYFESIDIHQEKSSKNTEKTLALKTFQAHQSLLYLHNLIDLSEDPKESKYNNPNEEIFI